MDEIDEAVVNNLLLPEKERLSNVRLAKAPLTFTVSGGTNQNWRLWYV